VTEIDELEGTRLAEAVAIAQGMTKATSKSGHAWFDAAGEIWIIAEKDPSLGALYRPDRNIAQAWELDGEGWLWNFLEFPDRLTAQTGIAYCSSYQVSVYWADFPTKAAAYATARCRAYLKAMAYKGS